MSYCDCCHEKEADYIGSGFGNVCEECWQAYSHAHVQLMDIEIGIQREICRMRDLDEQYGDVFRMELADVHKRIEQSCNSAHESYLLGVADGLVIAASHLGITLRPDLVEEEDV